MGTAPQLEMNGVPMSSHLKEIIEDHVRKLDCRYGRLTSCRLAMKAPGATLLATAILAPSVGQSITPSWGDA